MKTKIFKNAVLICITFILNCNYNSVLAETNKNLEIQSVDGKYIKFFGEAGLLDIQYSNLIFTTNSGINIIQPVYRGDKGNIKYEDLRQYCIKMGKLQSSETRISPIQVYCKKGEMKKTFHEFLTFYKSNLLKDVDIEHPAEFGKENKTWIINYYFKVNGVSGKMQIQVDGSEKQSPLYKSVYDIQPDENGGWFIYDITIRRTVP